MITAWILVTFVAYNSGVHFSPPVATEASCEAMKAVVKNKAQHKYDVVTCVKVEMHK